MGLEKKILSYYDDPTLDQDDTGFVLGRKGPVNVEKEMQERHLSENLNRLLKPKLKRAIIVSLNTLTNVT